MDVNDREFAELLAVGHERRGVEFKGPGARTDGYFFAKVVRAVLGMANLRDGGVVAVGVEELPNGGIVAIGLTSEQVATWGFEDVVGGLARYADPSVELEISLCRDRGQQCVVIEVRPFADVPILCKQEFSCPGSSGRTEVILRRGACYVRSRSRPETSEIPASEDMRDLLDLAAERRLRSFLGQAARSGVDLSQLTGASDDGRYAAEAVPAPSAVLSLIQTRGRWRVVIRPEQFKGRRIEDIHDLRQIVRRAEVQLAGWSFPYVRGEVLPQYGDDRISQELDWGHRLEWWQFHQSGQFIHEAGVPEDWRDRSEMWPAPSGWQSGVNLDVCDSLWRFTTAFEAAARFAAALADVDGFRIEVTGAVMRGRRLYADRDECAIRFDHAYVTESDTIRYELTFSEAELLADPAGHALRGATECFRRFGWQPRADLLREWQRTMSRH
jgi:hypothetical protein